MNKYLLLGMLTVVSSGVIAQTSQQIKEAKNFTNWVNRVVTLSPEQFENLKELKLNYLLEKERLKNNLGSEAKISALNDEFYLERDNVLEKEQKIKLKAYFLTSNEMKSLSFIENIKPERLDYIKPQILEANMKLIEASYKYGKHRQEFLVLEEKISLQKDEIISSILTTSQYEHYKEVKSGNLSKKSSKAFEYLDMKVDSEFEGYNVLTPEDL